MQVPFIVRLLIVEPESEGHHLVLYTRLILREADQRGWAVSILTTESGNRHPAFDILNAGRNAPVTTILMPDIAPATSFGSMALLAAQFRLWKGLAAAHRQNGGFADFDLVYCINLDYFEKALSVLGSPFGDRPFAGMLMNPKFHRASLGLGPPSRMDSIYSTLFRRLLRIQTLRRLAVIDEPFLEFCRAKRMNAADKISLVADVGEITVDADRQSARDNLGLSPDAHAVLLYGSLSRRKGLQELIRAVARVEDTAVVALIVGKPDDETAGFLASPICSGLAERGKLVVRAGFQDEQAEADVFAAADSAWLGYVGGAFGSSGVLYQAGSVGLPVISMHEGLIGWSVREYELGLTVDPGDEMAVATALRTLATDEALAARLGANGREHARSHTGSVFGSTICDALETAMAPGDLPGDRGIPAGRAE